jgi:hypothetical protein
MRLERRLCGLGLVALLLGGSHRAQTLQATDDRAPRPLASEIGQCQTFKPGSARIDKACQEVLRSRVIPALEADPDAKLVIDGSYGTKERVRNLDLQRASNVRDLLTNPGSNLGTAIAADRISVRGGGVTSSAYQVRMWLVQRGADDPIDPALSELVVGEPGQELPFYVDPSKRLPDEEISRKREGRFFTGLPRFQFDPIRGFGVGGNLFLFENGKREDALFEYTPYKYRVTTEFFFFQNGRIRYALQADVPYVFNTKWRLRADAVLWEDPEAQYWGIGRRSLGGLQFADKRGGSEGPIVPWRSVNAYEENLALAVPDADNVLRTDAKFNRFGQREQLYNVLLERVKMGGRLRLMFGYEALLTAFEDYSGQLIDDARLPSGGTVKAVQNQTLLRREKEAGVWDRFNLAGFDSRYNFTSMLAGALIYDTRDFEPDPTRGLFLQYSHEYSAPWAGSKFNFHKGMAQGQYIRTLAKSEDGSRRVTFAGLAALGHIWGSRINFIEMWDLSSQAEAGGIMVLGGERSLRGFREARFLAPTASLANLELRTRLAEFKAFKQDWSVGVTPFFDIGSIYDGLNRLTFNGFRSAPGVGGRLGWNRSTVIRLDFARSREGRQFFLGFGHIF